MNSEFRWKEFLFTDTFHTDQEAFREWDKKAIMSAVMKKDIPRIRSDIDHIQNKKTKNELIYIVHFFCIHNNIDYQQGMLDLAIPFIMLRIKKFKISFCYALFNGFMKKNKNLYLYKHYIHIRNNNYQQRIELPYNIATLYFIKLLISYHLPHILYLF